MCLLDRYHASLPNPALQRPPKWSGRGRAMLEAEEALCPLREELQALEAMASGAQVGERQGALLPPAVLLEARRRNAVAAGIRGQGGSGPTPPIVTLSRHKSRRRRATNCATRNSGRDSEEQTSVDGGRTPSSDRVDDAQHESGDNDDAWLREVMEGGSEDRPGQEEDGFLGGGGSAGPSDSDDDAADGGKSEEGHVGVGEDEMEDGSDSDLDESSGGGSESMDLEDEI